MLNMYAQIRAFCYFQRQVTSSDVPEKFQFFFCKLQFTIGFDWVIPDTFKRFKFSTLVISLLINQLFLPFCNI